VGGIIIAIYNDFFISKVLMGPTHADFPTYGWMCEAGKSLGMEKAFCMEKLGVKMQSTSVSGQFSMFFTVLIIGGIIIAFPYIFYEFWKFIKPALTKKELENTRGVIFWVSLLFFTGVFFGYFVIAPYTVNFFANFQLDESIVNQWTISSYIDTLIPLILGTGLAFQLPLVMFFLAKVGMVSPGYLRSVRKYAIVIIIIVVGVITPPDVISQIIVSLPLLILYEVSILLTARVSRANELQEAKEWS
jgi:sec-independent protein translocase protein TatC